MKRGERRVGFNQFRKTVRDKPALTRNVANCLSCKFLNHEGECTNSNVTLYDMVQEDHRKYCSFWSSYDYDNGRKNKKDEW